MFYVTVQFMMKQLAPYIFKTAILFFIATYAIAETVTAPVNVEIVRFLTLVNTSGLDFGKVSASGAAGSVVITYDGNRYATGGAAVDPADRFTPASFIIQGRPNETFTVQLPDKIELFDQNGNKITVENFQTNTENANLSPSGDIEINVGGKLNLDPNQPSGSYNGTLVIDVYYS